MQIDLVTAHLSLQDVLGEIDTKRIPANFLNTVAAKCQIEKKEDVPYVRKGFVLSDFQFDEGEKATIDYITTKMLDRDGEVVLPEGLDYSQFDANPVVVWCHDYKQLPVGRSLWHKMSDVGTLAKTKYIFANPFAKQLYEYRKEDGPIGVSLGFVPLRVRKSDPRSNQGLKQTYLNSLVLEYSYTPIPSNPGAVGMAVSKGLTTFEAMKRLWPGYDFEFDLNAVQSDENIDDARASALAKTLTEENIMDKVVCKSCSAENEWEEGIAFKACVCGCEIDHEGMVIKAAAKMVECKGCKKKVMWDEKALDAKGNMTCPECGAIIDSEGTVVPPEKKQEEKKKSAEDSWEAIKKEAVVKGVDLDGHVSAYDIIEAVNSFLCTKIGANGGSSPWKENAPYCSVRDIFPMTYPSGNVIFRVQSGGGVGSDEGKTYQANYTYDPATKAVMVDNPVEITQTWIRKSLSELYPSDGNNGDELAGRLNIAVKRYEALEEQIEDYESMEEEYKALQAEMIVLKEGRTISDKNKKLIQAAIEALTALVGAVESKTTEKSFQDDDVLSGISSDDVRKVLVDAVDKGMKITPEMIADAVGVAFGRVTGKVT